jgi:hypothetical protein
MKERDNNPMEGARLPPIWCSGICRNAMNEICVEHCAVKRDCSAFEPKPGLRLSDMPRFPLKESGSMTKEEKFMSVTIYLAKVVDHLQGVEEEHTIYPPLRREDMRLSEARVLPGNVQVDELLNSVSQEGQRSENIETNFSND